MVSMRHPFRTRRRTKLAALLTVCATLAAWSGAAHAAPFEASVDRQVVDAGDPVRLTLRFSGDEPIARPDLSPLAADFEIVGRQQSQRMSLVNGAFEQALEVELLLQPKHSGTLEIPALHAGDLASEPLQLTVRDAATATADPDAATAASPSGAPATTPEVVARAARDGQAPPDLFIEASADQKSPFVQGEVRYTVRVYDGIGIREGALTTPEAGGARIEPRGDTRTREQVVGGRRYVVHEREFALFPQSAGELTIPPVVLQARVPDQDGRARRSPFDDGFGDDVFAEMFAQMRAGGFGGGSLIDRMMNPGREVRVRSNPVTLSVQGRPGEAGTGWFLPATAVTLTQSWSPAKPTFRVGETVRRTIRLTADGASAAQLPALAAADVDGVKQYGGKPETRSIAGAGGPAAELTQTFDLLPTSSGTITLPRVEVAWWDVASSTQRTAVLAEEIIEVLPAAGPTTAAATQTAPHAQAQTNGARPDTSAVAVGSTAGAATTPADVTPDDAAWNAGTLLASHPLAGGTGALVLVALGGTAFWVVRRRRLSTHTTAAQAAAHTAPRVPARALVDALHRACTSGDARAVRDALLTWARASWSDAPPANAAAVAQRLGDPTFARAVKSLDDSFYAPHATSFDGAAFWRAFQQARRAANPAASDAFDVLPALYPDSRMA